MAIALQTTNGGVYSTATNFAGGVYDAAYLTPSVSSITQDADVTRVFLILSFEANGNVPTVSSISYGGVTPALVAESVSTSGGAFENGVYVYEVIEANLPASGSGKTASVTLTAGGDDCASNLAVVLLTGAGSETVDGLIEDHQNTSGNVSFSVTPAVVSSTILSFAAQNQPQTTTCNRTELFDVQQAGTNTNVGQIQIGAAASAQTQTFTWSAPGSVNRSAWVGFAIREASTAVDSSGTVALGSVTASGAGSLAHQSSGAVALGSVTAAGTGNLTHQSSGTVSLGAVSATGAGTLTHQSSGAVVLGAVTAAGTGNVEITSAGAVSLGAVQATGSGTLTHESSGAVALAAVTAAGSSTLTHQSSGTVSLGAVSVTGAGSLAHDSAGAVSLAATQAAGAGTLTHQSSGAVSLGAVTASGSSESATESSGAVALGAVQATGAGSLTHQSSGTVSLASVLASGSGALVHDSSGAVSLGAVEAAGTSNVEIASAGAVALGAVTASGASTLTHQSSGAVNLPAVTAVGSSSPAVESDGAVTLAAVTAAGTSDVFKESAGAVTLAAVTASGSSTLTIDSFGAITLPRLDVSGAGTLTHQSSGAVALPSITASGDSTVVGFILFIVEDGTGLANANAYASLDYVRQYWLDRGVTLSFNDSELSSKIINATDYVEVLYLNRFRGTALTETQALSWPREYVYDADGNRYDPIPKPLQDAIAQYAISGADFVDVTAEQISIKRTRNKVGPLENEIEYIGGVAQSINQYPLPDQLIKRLVYGSGGSSYR